MQQANKLAVVEVTKPLLRMTRVMVMPQTYQPHHLRHPLLLTTRVRRLCQMMKVLKVKLYPVDLVEVLAVACLVVSVLLVVVVLCLA
jgi:hypothetical protein